MIARFLILFTAFWLPMQALAGMIMPLGMHAQPVVAVAEPVHDMSDEVACPGHISKADDGAASTVPEVSCQHCGACQMACAGYLPASAPALAGAAPQRLSRTPAALEPPSHVAEPLDHPPRHAH